MDQIRSVTSRQVCDLSIVSALAFSGAELSEIENNVVYIIRVVGQTPPSYGQVREHLRCHFLVSELGVMFLFTGGWISCPSILHFVLSCHFCFINHWSLKQFCCCLLCLLTNTLHCRRSFIILLAFIFC